MGLIDEYFLGIHSFDDNLCSFELTDIGVMNCTSFRINRHRGRAKASNYDLVPHVDRAGSELDRTIAWWNMV